MTKIIIPNIPGHYEMSGIEVDIAGNQIIIRTQSNQQKQRDPRLTQHQARPENYDDGNRSILSSVGTLIEKFGPKQKKL